MTLILTIIKLLPILFPILRGLIGGLNSINQAGKKVAPAINQKKLEELVKSITIQQVKKIVNEHRGEIQSWVPSPEEKAQEDKINNLLDVLQKRQDEYSKKNPGKK